MEIKENIELKILSLFFDNPEKAFLIREISRIIKVNHTTVRQYLKKIEKEEYVKLENEGIYKSYKSNITRKYLNLKLFYNLEMVRSSGIIEFIEKELSYPIIILFGSYAQASNNKDSDIDMFIMGEVKKELPLNKFENFLKRKVSIHLFNKRDFEVLKRKNPMLVNNLVKGIVISGELEIL